MAVLVREVLVAPVAQVVSEEMQMVALPLASVVAAMLV